MAKKTDKKKDAELKCSCCGGVCEKAWCEACVEDMAEDTPSGDPVEAFLEHLSELDGFALEDLVRRLLKEESRLRDAFYRVEGL